MPPLTLTSSDPTPWSLRALYCFATCLVFSACYMSTNAFAFRRRVDIDVAMALDQHLPFVPWMIVPYMSSGLIFVGSFWWVLQRDDLRVLAQRLMLATVAASLIFVVWPLRFSFERPVLASPAWATLYALLDVWDLPYNQCPSLHVAYCAILGASLAQRWHNKLAQIAMWTWLLMVSISTLFTYQHHMLDVAGGAVLGVFCILAVQPKRLHPWVAFYYGVAACVWWVLAFDWLSVWLTAYGSFSLLLVSIAYANSNPHFLHKTDGRYPISTRLLYAPYLLTYGLTWLAVQWHERHQPPFSKLDKLLWVGRRLTARQAKQLPQGCTVIDLANELQQTPGLRDQRYHFFPMLDLVPIPEAQMEQVLAILDRERSVGRLVYLHCAMGYARSVHVAQIHLSRTTL